MDQVIEYETCPSCGQRLPAPEDGRWRFAKSGKTYPTAEAAQEQAVQLNRSGSSQRFEFRAVTDAEGRHRIASRRR